MPLPFRHRPFWNAPDSGQGRFSPALVARRAAAEEAGNLRTSLGTEAERIGDADAFAGMIRGMLAAGGIVKLTARPGRAVVAEMRGVADIAASVDLLGGALEERAGVLRAILPLMEAQRADIPEEPSLDLRLTGCRLLVADDSATNRLVLSEMLRSGGAEVSLADCGPEAVRLAAEGTFDLLLLDIAMPGMDGIEALAAIRTQGIRVPAVAVTANAMDHQVEEYLACGFASHLAKPLRREDLIRNVAGLIG